MPHRDPRVDAYIAKAAPFARPILKKIRAAWHKADPELEETIKWGIPYFQKNGLVGGMAAFKAHVSLGFWKAKDLGDPKGILGDGSSMCAARIGSVSDLPSENVLIGYMREAIALNEVKEQATNSERKPVKVPALPTDFRRALERKGKALDTFRKFAPSRRKEYVEWIVQAKQSATRERRIEQAVEWIGEGKPRHWKHMRKS